MTTKATFELDGVTYTLKINFNAMCRVEEELDTGFREIIADFAAGNVRFGRLGTLVQGALIHELPDITRDQAGAIIEGVGPERIGEALAAAIADSPLFKARTPKRRGLPK